MAKKNYVKIDAGTIEITSAGADSSLITVIGNNSHGTQIELKIKLDDWYLPGIIKGAAAIGRRRVEAAISINKRIMEAIN